MTKAQVRQKTSTMVSELARCANRTPLERRLAHHSCPIVPLITQYIACHIRTLTSYICSPSYKHGQRSSSYRTAPSTIPLYEKRKKPVKKINPTLAWTFSIKILPRQPLGTMRNNGSPFPPFHACVEPCRFRTSATCRCCLFFALCGGHSPNWRSKKTGDHAVLRVCLNKIVQSLVEKVHTRYPDPVFKTAPEMLSIMRWTPEPC